MIMVVFEFTVRQGKQEAYFKFAKKLQPEVEKIDGFLGVERFQSCVDENKFVSVSRWRDEVGVTLWRDQFDHKNAQKIGKNEIFESFAVRVVDVIREITL